ncbi:MAG: hypothetical protein K2I21_01550, partial [Acetatifactor sp.]|nr:hypothetical protein [Acetatifactor sp.]
MSQNNMNQKNWNEWKIDKRSQKDIEDRIEELASSYVPEWHPDRENPDIGSVIAKIFASQMAENLKRYNQVLERYHTEFVNMLGISLLPPKPASATVVMELVHDTIPGAAVYKGTKLLADTEQDSGQIIFETAHNLYVTNSVLESVFMTTENGGKIIPLKGRFETAEIAGAAGTGEEETFAEEENGLIPFRLFGNELEGIQKNALLLYHSMALDVENNNIYVKIQGNAKLLEKIAKRRYQFYYLAEEGLVPVEKVQVLSDGETVILRKEKKNLKTELEGKQYSLLALVAEEPIEENFSVSRIAMSSSGEKASADFAGSGATDFDVQSFDPFGDTLSLYQECYL